VVPVAARRKVFALGSYGMPRLNTRFKHMAFFLFGKDPKTGKVIGPLGTGIFVTVEAKGPWLYHRHIYAVTCHHVAVTGGGSIIRVNTKDGASRLLELEPDEWYFIGGGPDICAADVTERLTGQDEYSVLPPNLIASEKFLANEEIEIGEDGFMLGLFADHPGEKQNLIAARFGNLSLLAHREEPIEQPNGCRRPSHIFDMRSRPGFSGSPVFVYRTPGGDLRDHADRGRLKRARRRAEATTHALLSDDLTQFASRSLMNRIQDERETESNTFVVLLGIHAGQYPERVEAIKLRKISGESDDTIRHGDRLKIASSMTVVVPAWEITTLLNLPPFETQRNERDRRMEKERYEKNAPEPESATERPALGDEDIQIA
jgi:hypothetical protein